MNASRATKPQFVSDSEPPALTIGALARESKTTIRTVRFYEEQGIICADGRTLGKHRRYPRAAVERLRLVILLRQGGLALDEIRTLLAVRSRSASTRDAAQDLDDAVAVHLDVIAKRVAQLQNLRVELERLRDTLARCRVCKDRLRLREGCRGCEIISPPNVTNQLMRLFWKCEP